MPKGVPNKRYTPEFKKLVVETMQEETLSYNETARRFEINDHKRIMGVGAHLLDRRTGKLCH